MISPFSVCTILLGIVFLSPMPVLALDPSLDISQYAHTSWKVRDGLIAGEIDAIAQTPDGYLWLGTELGLYRFDGLRTTRWQPPAGEQIPSDYIRTLLVSRDGTLWIGTSKGLASWKDGKLIQYPQVAGRIVFGLLQDRAGKVWFGTSLPGSVCAIQSGIPECHGAGFGRFVFALCEDWKGDLWILSETGLWRWDSVSPQQYKFPRGITDAISLVEDANGTLLMATNDGLKQFVGGRIQGYSFGGFTGKFRPNVLFRSSDGSLWVGSTQGLLHLHQGIVDTFGTANGLSDAFVNSIFEDREGNVWVGTANGLDRFRDYAVPVVSEAQGLSQSHVFSVQATPDGSVWISTPSGLNRWRDGQVTVYGDLDAQQQAPGSVLGHRQTTRGKTDGGLVWHPQSLGLDARGRLLVSTNDGAFYLDGSHFVRMAGVPGGNTSAIAGNLAGNVWIGNQGIGLFHWKEEPNTADLTTSNQLKTESLGVAAIAPDSSRGGLWLGFIGGGVAFFEDGQIQKSYKASDGLGAGIVRDVRLGPGGTLWVATDGGLSRIKDGMVTTLTSKNGLPCDSVHWSIEDEEQSVWLSMPCGLARIARSELDAWVNNSQRLVSSKVFDLSDGVTNRNSAGGYTPHVTMSADGRIWFATPEGVAMIDPRHLRVNTLPPPVHIEQIIADDKRYDLRTGIHLPPNVRNIRIEYTALSMVAPEKIHFKYKLEGQNQTWHEVINERQATYTNLPPRNYRFRVIASNNSGVWNEQGTLLDFSIDPAYYQTRWFLASCVIVFLASLYGLYRLRLYQLAREFNMNLESRVNERTRIARDLHDTLLQSFHGLLLRFQNAYDVLPPDADESREQLEKAIDNAAQALTEGREAVQALRTSTIESNDLAVAVRTVGEELGSATGNENPPGFQVEIKGKPRNLHPMQRDEIYKIAVEALRNAFQHADARNIEVEIRYEDRRFSLHIRDDGKGIDPKVLVEGSLEGHFGLRGIKERAAIAGGKLAIWSQPGGGTEIELTIPASHAYLMSRQKLSRG